MIKIQKYGALLFFLYLMILLIFIIWYVKGHQQKFKNIFFKFQLKALNKKYVKWKRARDSVDHWHFLLHFILSFERLYCVSLFFSFVIQYIFWISIPTLAAPNYGNVWQNSNETLLTTSIICISVKPKLNWSGSDSLTTGRSNVL